MNIMKQYPSELKECWQKFFDKEPLPKQELIYRRIITKARKLRDRFISLYVMVHEHTLYDDTKQLETLGCICEIIDQLLEMLYQFRNLLHCIPHSYSDRKRLDSLIAKIASDEGEIFWLIDIVEKDFMILRGRTPWDQIHIIPPPEWYRFCPN